MGLTPFEIMCGHPSPVIPSLQTDLIADLDDQDMFNAIQQLQSVRKTIWPKLWAIYEAASVPSQIQTQRLGFYPEASPKIPEAEMEEDLHGCPDNTNGPQGGEDHLLDPLFTSMSGGSLCPTRELLWQDLGGIEISH